MGTIVLSLPSSPGTPSIDIATSTQVRIFSVANTLSRLLVGPLADFLSPIATSDTDSKKGRVSRVYFFSAAALLLCSTFLWTDIRVKSQEALSILRYSFAFSVV